MTKFLNERTIVIANMAAVLLNNDSASLPSLQSSKVNDAVRAAVHILEVAEGYVEKATAQTPNPTWQTP